MRSVFYPHMINGPWGDPALFVRLSHRPEALLFDCGDISRLESRQTQKIRALFLSHAHIDHLAGFDTLLRLLLYRPTPLLVCGPPGIVDQMIGRLSGYTWNLTESYPFSLIVREWGIPHGREVVLRARHRFQSQDEVRIDCPGGVMEQTPYYTVRAVPLDHGDIPSLAYTLEEPRHVAIHKEALKHSGYRPGSWLTAFKDVIRTDPESRALVTAENIAGAPCRLPAATLAQQIAHTERGMKLCYVTDVSPTAGNIRKIIELARQAHLLAIEGTFAHKDRQRARERNHLTAWLAGHIGYRAKASRLLVFHHSPRYHRQPARLCEEAEAAFRGSPPPKEDKNG